MSAIMGFLATYSEVLSVFLGLFIATVWQLLRDKWNHDREASAHLRSIRLDMHAELLAAARQLRVDMSHDLGQGARPVGHIRMVRNSTRSMDDLLPRIELVGSRAAYEAAAALVQSCNELVQSPTSGALQRVSQAEGRYLRTSRKELGIKAH